MVLFTVFTLLFIAVSVAMILIILVQRPQGGGLATAFGGAGGGNDTAFGGRTGDALTAATVGVFTLFLLLAIGVNITDSPETKKREAPAVSAPTDGAATMPATTPAAT
ncbi:MAG: preprotein translocase subunit SecG, partial [Phycisphaerae bacterium]|nr:preprotein translocase subunit SecG [Phycisphaerae bacterium]